MAGPGGDGHVARAPEEAAEHFVGRWRYRLSRIVLRGAVAIYSRLEVDGVDRLPRGAAILCFNHLNWSDPLFVMAGLPYRRLFFFGPEQADMRRGARNRLMRWAGIAVPYRPGRRGLVAATRRVEAILERGEPLAIAGEGRIHAGERDLLPLNDGPAVFALHCGVPLVPVAINGTAWLGFRRRIRVRVGEAIAPGRGDGSQATAGELTAALDAGLRALVSDFPEPAPSGRVGRWLTELFNEWPEGSRPAPGGEHVVRPAVGNQ